MFSSDNLVCYVLGTVNKVEQPHVDKLRSFEKKDALEKHEYSSLGLS